jgi:hypothetical protein
MTVSGYFPKTIQILLRYHSFADCFAEVQPGYSFENAVADIFNGEFTCHRVLAVFETGEEIQTREISNEIADALIERMRKGEQASKTAKEFISWCFEAEGDEILEELQAAE